MMKSTVPTLPTRKLSAKESKAVDAEIARLEETYAITLPADYVEFLRDVGPGEYAEYFRIAGLHNGAGPKWKVFLLDAELARFRDEEAQAFYVAEFGRPKLFPTLIPFASNFQGDQFLFDAAGHVAMIARLRPKFFRKVADSFEGFLRFCVDGGFQRALGYDEEEAGPPTFVPLATILDDARPKSKKKPTKK